MKASVRTAKKHAKKRLLIIEDEPFILALYRDAFLHQPLDVQIAVNKQTGLASIEQSQPHVILLDLLIPIGFGEIVAEYEHPVGFDILEYVKRNRHLQSIKVIVLSNLDSDQSRDHARKLGADEYLIKAQTDPHDVVKIVCSIVGVPHPKHS